MSDSFLVLVADDEPVTRTRLASTLRRENFTVLVAANGFEALELYRQNHPSLVITDWMMPDLSGIDLCAAIRSESAERFPYVIFLTGLAQKKNVIAGLDAGANDYLTKPFQPDELLARVRVGRKTVELQEELARKNRFLERLALTDPLTGIPNRRALEELAAREFAAAARHGYAAWVVIADIDRFKSINDTYGHDAGDEVLKTTARVLKTSFRQSDCVGRLGGEEFVLLLTHADAEQARLAVERVREELAIHPFQWKGQALTVTASFGLAGGCPAGAGDFTSMLARADAALYSAKKNGRNRVELDAQAKAALGGILHA
jgi:two-component system chemotaxis response regulator CheY